MPTDEFGLHAALDKALWIANRKRCDAILAVLGMLVSGSGSDFESPIFTGVYSLNHRIAVNDERARPTLYKNTSWRQLVASPVAIDVGAQVARERRRTYGTTLEDRIAIVNDVPYADYIEQNGTKTKPDGRFYEKAGQYLNELLDLQLNREAEVIE